MKGTNNWFQVGCDDTYGVEKLQLTFNNLAGSIPSQFGLASTLTGGVYTYFYWWSYYYWGWADAPGLFRGNALTG